MSSKRLNLRDRMSGALSEPAAEPEPPQAPSPDPHRETRTHTPQVQDTSLDRREFFLRTDQSEDLNALRKQLNAERKASGSEDPLIKHSALIRVAVDLFLSHADQIRGTNETDILRSVLDNESQT